ncbi:sulfite exporter TauE/SafE [bacterium BMS3Abin07]|nr:sulfite exporter TauE/SafE [bacterium BMS3Abin07]HDO21998.1 sulfite exporter TauE/SafE family protein [Nitrospirota bacterium]HDZ87716.1 sulfite exporter TauE/SafE family protein [Nitrospirota bacterium]
MEMFTVLLILGLFGGFLSGLLGLGGAIIMIPLMLIVPKLLGVGILSMKAVAGLSMIQVVFASISGVSRHRKNKFVSMKLLLILGIAVALGSGFGSIISKYMSNQSLMVAFGVIAVIAAIMMFIPPRNEDADNITDPDSILFNKPLAAVLGLVIGMLAGMVGAGGGFILIPVMIYVLRVPIRVTIGTSLGIVFIGAIFGAVGKMATGQVDWLLALALIISSIPSAQLGSVVSKKTPALVLRYSLMLIIIFTSVEIWYKVLV